MGLSRPQFARIVGMKPKRLENIENGLQRMHDEDFEKVCSTFEEFSRWISYEGPIETKSIALEIADSAQKAAVYLVNRNPVLLEKNGMDIDSWRQRHQDVIEALSQKEQEVEELRAQVPPIENFPVKRRARRKTS